MGSTPSTFAFCCASKGDARQDMRKQNRHRLQVEGQNHKLIQRLTHIVNDLSQKMQEQTTDIACLKDQLILQEAENIAGHGQYEPDGDRLSSSLEKAKTNADMKAFLMSQYKSVDISEESSGFNSSFSEGDEDGDALTQQKNEMTAQLAHLISNHVAVSPIFIKPVSPNWPCPVSPILIHCSSFN
eukprot:UN03156